MKTIYDIAKYITEKAGEEITAMKLQKLMYYSQAWTLVWDEEPLFDEDFQAWANGPVLPNLYAFHRGMFKVNAKTFATADSNNLSIRDKENIDRVYSFYGEKSGQWLSQLTHQEKPWLNARGALPAGEPSDQVIPKAEIYEYYSSL